MVVEMVAGESVNSSSSEAERVKPMASRRLAWASTKASIRKSAASPREDSVSARLAISSSVQVGSAEATIYPPTVMIWGLAGKSRRISTTEKN